MVGPERRSGPTGANVRFSDGRIGLWNREGRPAAVPDAEDAVVLAELRLLAPGVAAAVEPMDAAPAG